MCTRPRVWGIKFSQNFSRPFEKLQEEKDELMRLNTPCRFPSLLYRKALANPFGGIGMVSKSESSLVLASTSHQDRVFRRDTWEWFVLAWEIV